KRIFGVGTVMVIKFIIVGVIPGESYPLKGSVINIHSALGEISRVEVVLAVDRSTGQPSVGRTVGCFEYSHSMSRGWAPPLVYGNCRVPSSNRPISCDKKEHCWFAGCE